ncbi:transcriptional regulator, TetR family [Aeromicrobium marinum DSM 15272]|uniref:Transcriptional regulator, TetR family n=1 Tax=Aeromicrobium marinum DSM 15272 TaxID=585531 RepID=E2SDM2_9ACTN|nr:TetR family transcriptional regulator [Aeromicrobium marinum]EFQ82599.1 transcriptional regulator, TetR family [Aeromicrobium marinum DSM 15272]
MTALEVTPPLPVLMRDRLLDAAQGLIERRGWSTVTMARIAEAVGVSRQTVYNELGTKRQLAEHLAMRELARFLDVVRERMSERDDLVEAVQWTCQGVLEMGERSLLVRTIVGSVPGEQDPDLLKILTVESGEIVDTAGVVVKECITRHPAQLPLTDPELDIAVETVVRLVMSAITRPSKPAEAAAADIGWILRLALVGAAHI